MSDEEKEQVRGNPASKIVFLEGVWADIASIFLQIPWEYGFSGAVGKKYEAIKDYLRWNGYKPKEWTPIIVQMAARWIEATKTER